MTSSSIDARLGEIRSRFVARLRDEVDAMLVDARALDGTRADLATMERLHARLHRLAGAGATFGFPDLTDHARSLEKRLARWLQREGRCPCASHRAQLVTDLRELHELAAAPQVPGVEPSSTRDAAGRPAEPFLDRPSSRVDVGIATSTLPIPREVWILEPDRGLRDELARALAPFGYHVRSFASFTEARRTAGNARPGFLLVDIELDDEDAVTTLRPGLGAWLDTLDCPIHFLASADTFDGRLRAARLGADGFFAKPIDVPRLINRTQRVLEAKHPLPPRVLTVEDDPDQQEHIALVLRDAGIEVMALDNPRTLLDAMEAFRPDLLLMDLHMPQCSGPELASLVRQFDRWANLPIAFLSAERDPAAQADAMRRGADDFFTKPVNATELVAVIASRVARARALDTHVTRDSLTGLLKHAPVRDALTLEIARARRSGLPLSVCMLDIDHFKRVNDTWGHPTGDLVISSVAMLLRQRLRSTDIIGRYGGEEFVAILPGCPLATARRILDELRERFASIVFHDVDADFSCTISAGIATWNPLEDLGDIDLIDQADQALYRAKADGRNRVVASPALALPTSAP